MDTILLGAPLMPTIEMEITRLSEFWKISKIKIIDPTLAGGRLIILYGQIEGETERAGQKFIRFSEVLSRSIIEINPNSIHSIQVNNFEIWMQRIVHQNAHYLKKDEVAGTLRYYYVTNKNITVRPRKNISFMPIPDNLPDGIKQIYDEKYLKEFGIMI